MAERMPPSELAEQVRAVARKAHDQRRSMSQEERDQTPGAITSAIHMVAAHIRNLGSMEDVHTYCKGLLGQTFDPASTENRNASSKAEVQGRAENQAGEAGKTGGTSAGLNRT